MRLSSPLLPMRDVDFETNDVRSEDEEEKVEEEEDDKVDNEKEVAECACDSGKERDPDEEKKDES